MHCQAGLVGASHWQVAFTAAGAGLHRCGAGSLHNQRHSRRRASGCLCAAKAARTHDEEGGDRGDSCDTDDGADYDGGDDASRQWRGGGAGRG